VNTSVDTVLLLAEISNDFFFHDFHDFKDIFYTQVFLREHAKMEYGYTDLLTVQDLWQYYLMMLELEEKREQRRKLDQA